MAGVAMYNIFGRQVGAHWLSMATLGSAAALPFLFGGKKTEPGSKNTPPINASSKAEEDFISDFLKDSEKK
ncbi:uncharacterized protein AB675_2185 [Cyphellophora attinorum]|uniref:ATP synthase subunit K, mitochondrial n=1 Tax=Cyphellophora attinorum TaxID=1664694 RepID=A0A0N1P1Z9_9EURO|nr:uncharacterized protein AB675_2185 [Phialophora attinorum]KPI42907.1 hypothetical protein AB675_2185 [Phialophora attinorum]